MEYTNHGVLLGQRPEDWVAGEATFITYEVRNPSGDWRPYLPVKEIQYGKEDSMSCVSFSAVNAIEIQQNFLDGNNPNYSDRWIAKRSGTTHEGNYLYKVADTIRKEGLVLESDYPTPPNYTFDEFHADIPPEKLAFLSSVGQQWLKQWDFKYEFVPATKDQMLLHLKQAPLQIVIPGHAIVNFLCEADVVNYFDTYQPHEKQTAYGNIQSALKPLIVKKNMAKTFIINDNGKIGVAVLEGFTGTVVFAKTPQDLANLKLALEVPDDAPLYNYPN